MSGLRLDYTNCLTERVGEAGVAPDAIEEASGRLAELTWRLQNSRGSGDEQWRQLALEPARREHLGAVGELVAKLAPQADNLLVLGIGGSALGNIALHAALNPLLYNHLPRGQRQGPRLFVLDNVDPLLVAAVLDELRRSDPGLQHTVVNVISKSGETAETAAQFMIVQGLLRAALGERHADRVVATTDPRAGTLREICQGEGYATLPVPDGVGGRFSVLSPVGLFSAAMCGIDAEALLDGAAAMDERCSSPQVLENPAALLAWLLVEQGRRGRDVHVLMPYSNALYPLADWFRQLWAESLGKATTLDGRPVAAGFTPVKALGATDQHSQIQLYREGPDDKVIGFVEVEVLDRDVAIPAGLGVETLRYLEGSSLASLLAAEKRATEFALLESGRPNYTITLPRLDAWHVGQFIQLWEVTTAYAGLLLQINAFDQPAVETGKQATFGLMGRAGYEQLRQAVQQRLGGTPRVV